MQIVQKILDLGAPIMMPMIIAAIGLIVGMKPLKAVRAGLTVGIGFIGLNLITGLMSSYVGPLITGLQETWHLSLDTFDMGWPVSSGIAFSNGSFVVLMFGVIIAINLLMLIFKLTDTLNVDLWNYWHFIMGGALVYAITDNLLLACAAGGAYSGIVLYLASKQADRIGEFLGTPGITVTAQSFPVMIYICQGIDWVIDRIPFVNKINFSLTERNSKIAFLGEPVILGFLLGSGLTALGGMGWESAVTAGVGMSAVMFIMPRMIKILMEGLAPLSTAAQDFMSRKFPGRKINVGMDLAILTGNKDVITLAMLMIPITLLLAVVLPGNRLLPFTDLPAITYYMVAPIMIAKKNSFRALILGICTSTYMLYIATDLIPLVTQVGKVSGIVDAGVASISAFSGGGEIIAWVIVRLVGLFT